MRMDRRLESQRLLMESVRHKLIRGIQGDESDGFQGIQKALHRLDIAGDGYLDERVFTKQFIQRLKIPLTRPEREFLLEQLRAPSTAQGDSTLDYEQLGRICNLNSDDSLSESAEKQLNAFLQTPLVVRKVGDQGNSNHIADTPRCLFTGAEKFLEIAEVVDQHNSGLLHEDEFPQILSKCGVNIDRELLNGILSRFPRSNGKQISYAAFLLRYGQDPQRSRARRELKELVLHLLAQLIVPAADWQRFLHERFEKYDKKVHGMTKGILSTEGRSIVLKLAMDEAAQVTSLFLRASTNSSPSHLYYHEFLMFIDECHRMPRVVASSQSLKVTESESASTPDLDTSEMSVGDYLMSHATAPERRNFENLMEMLQQFQSTSAENNLQPIANGILLPLGKKLRVQVQFSID
ncbi:uncharacterized protein KRP23_4182 [Phytophthora ramorum]|uniref:uncharacterized protein n=1 Tax=Phytophthora ramorum TaxID=164328 RepID=UPI0030A82304|nr:hypothetical protein KRP23_4182 [Phytophthora ramorum]